MISDLNEKEIQIKVQCFKCKEIAVKKIEKPTANFVVKKYVCTNHISENQ